MNKFTNVKWLVVVPKATYKTKKYEWLKGDLKVAIMPFEAVMDFNEKQSPWGRYVTDNVGWSFTAYGDRKQYQKVDYYEFVFKNKELFERACITGGATILGDTLVLSGQGWDDTIRAIEFGEVPFKNDPLVLKKNKAASFKFIK